MTAFPSPLRYSPGVERPEDDEAQTAQDLVATLTRIAETTFKDGGHALRSVHAKSHGLLQGELEVLGGLDPHLAQGLFAQPARYPVVMRFSTIPGDVLDDSVSTPRGLGIKIIGTQGERLPGSEGAVTQDFVLVNGPAFGAPTAKAFLGNLKLVAATTDRFEGAKKAISAALRGFVSLTGGEPGPTVAALGGQPETHILGDTFYSQVPLRHGDHIAKISVAPLSPELKALEKAPLDFGDDPNALRDAVVAFFRRTGGEWEVRAQLCTNLEDMPVEDAAKRWPEDLSPYRAIGRIRVGPQTAWSAARSAVVDDGLAFSPWHGLAAHRPLGSVMRVRRITYAMSAKFRAEHNATPVVEPTEAVVLPD